MSWLSHPRVVRGCQIAIGLVFVWSALAKLGDLPSFATEVHNFRIVPLATENLLAMTLPWIELLAALAMVLNLHARAGAVVVTTLLALFTLGVVVATMRGLDIECGCFGTAHVTKVGLGKILENTAMLAVAYVATRRPR